MMSVSSFRGTVHVSLKMYVNQWAKSLHPSTVKPSFFDRLLQIGNRSFPSCQYVSTHFPTKYKSCVLVVYTRYQHNFDTNVHDPPVMIQICLGCS